MRISAREACVKPHFTHGVMKNIKVNTTNQILEFLTRDLMAWILCLVVMIINGGVSDLTIQGRRSYRKAEFNVD